MCIIKTITAHFKWVPRRTDCKLDFGYISATMEMLMGVKKTRVVQKVNIAAPGKIWRIGMRCIISIRNWRANLTARTGGVVGVGHGNPEITLVHHWSTLTWHIVQWLNSTDEKVLVATRIMMTGWSVDREEQTGGVTESTRIGFTEVVIRERHRFNHCACLSFANFALHSHVDK